MDPKELIRTSYDVISSAYRADNAEDDQEGPWLEELAALLPAGGAILDLGCGNGIPAARWLKARGFRVTGIDISSVQIQRAQRLVPDANFWCADFTQLDFSVHSFEAIISFFAIIHVPVEEQPTLLRHIHDWLQPGGWFMATVGVRSSTGVEENWLDAGAPMYWSHADFATFRRWMSDAGLAIESERFIPEGDGGHMLVLAHKGTREHSA